MSESTSSDGFAEIINLLAAPLAGGLRSMEQMKRGVDEMWRAVENLNTTMENLNETAMRVNRLLEEIEQPVKAMIPQLTRTIQAADEMTQRLEAPVKAAAPNIERIAETLSNPGFATLPNQISDVMNTIGDVSRRLGPLAALAENAGGLFGGFRFPGTGGSPSLSKPEPTESHPPAKPAEKPTAKKAAPKKKAATTSTAKKAATKKSPAKKKAAKKRTGSS